VDTDFILKEHLRMPSLIPSPSIVQAAGNKPKVIEEFIGRVNSNIHSVSIAKMKSPCGWKEPGQTPAFDEYTVVLQGLLRVNTKSGTFDITAGQAFIANRGEWIQYSTPETGGAEYISVCIPAFSPENVHRDVDSQ
jgi:mannose-6-phosphate isomerase-like protein (cupin superfamily)